MVTNKLDKIIIASRCGGAESYKTLKKEFNNPFMYSYIEYDDFFYLATHFNEIDFKKFKTKLVPLKNNKKCVLLTIDECVKVNYPHHLYSDKYEGLKDTIDYYSSNIEQYVSEKYLERLSRMEETLNEEKNNVVFIYLRMYEDDISDKEAEKLEQNGINVEPYNIWKPYSYNKIKHLLKYFTNDTEKKEVVS